MAVTTRDIAEERSMTLASRCWWQEAGTRVTGGLLILAGVLLMLASQLFVTNYADWGMLAGLIMVALGTVIIVVVSKKAWMT